MAKKELKATVINYGEYKIWNRTSKELPELIKISDSVKGKLNAEFGMIVQITGGKGETIAYTVEHPPFRNEKGNIEEPFIGEYFINSNDFKFYLGDSIWEPLYDKVGNWTFSVKYKNKIIAKKTILITSEADLGFDW